MTFLLSWWWLCHKLSFQRCVYRKIALEDRVDISHRGEGQIYLLTRIINVMSLSGAKVWQQPSYQTNLGPHHITPLKLAGETDMHMKPVLPVVWGGIKYFASDPESSCLQSVSMKLLHTNASGCKYSRILEPSQHSFHYKVLVIMEVFHQGEKLSLHLGGGNGKSFICFKQSHAW